MKVRGTSEGLTIGYDRFLSKKTGKPWRVPFVRYTHPGVFTIDYTLVSSLLKRRFGF